jgi:Holliday junction resolvase RusA-like endonuclease
VITVILKGDPEPKRRHLARIITPRSKPPFIQTYADPRGVKYETSLAWVAKAAMRGKAPIEGPVEVRVMAICRVPSSWPRRDRDAALAGVLRPTGVPDADNYLKNIDALNEIVWKDDAQVVDARAVKIYGEEPMLKIEIEPLRLGDLFAEAAE